MLQFLQLDVKIYFFAIMTFLYNVQQYSKRARVPRSSSDMNPCPCNPKILKDRLELRGGDSVRAR